MVGVRFAKRTDFAVFLIAIDKAGIVFDFQVVRLNSFILLNNITLGALINTNRSIYSLGLFHRILSYLNVDYMMIFG